jgi:H+/Cl- antiporter ClcA
MEVVVLTGLAASASYAVFVGLEALTFLEAFRLPVSANDLVRFEVRDLALAVGLGALGGLVGLVGVVLLGLCTRLGDAVRRRLTALGRARLGLARLRLGVLLAPVVGGALYGLLAVAFPLTLGDGNAQLKTVIAQGRNLGVGALVATACGKMLCLGVCLGFGFVGGQIFPLIFTGACVGVALWVASCPAPAAAAGLLLGLGPPKCGLELVLVVPCMIVAVPCAFAPVCFTMVVITCLLLELGGGMAAPVFVSAFISFLTVCGMGIVQKLITRGKIDGDLVDEGVEEEARR